MSPNPAPNCRMPKRTAPEESAPARHLEAEPTSDRRKDPSGEDEPHGGAPEGVELASRTGDVADRRGVPTSDRDNPEEGHKGGWIGLPPNVITERRAPDYSQALRAR
jgi:hypothetical protein